MRMGGLGSGIDTDQMVKDMMKIEQAKVDKVKSQKVYKEWQQSSYRDMIKAMNEFKGKYFDVLKKDTYLKSPSTFSANKAKSSNEDIVTVTNSGTIGNYDRTIKVIKKAKAASTESTVPISENYNSFQGTGAIDKTKLTAGFTISTALDGNVKMIRLKGDMTTATDSDLQLAYNDLLKEAYGTDKNGDAKIQVTVTGGKMNIALSNEVKTSKFEVMDILDNGAIGILGFEGHHVTNRLDTSKTLKEFIGPSAGDEVKFKINDKEFTFQSTKKISDMMKEINASDIGVAVRYDSVTDKIKIESKDMGNVAQIKIEDVSGGMFAKLNLNGANAKGQDAIVELNGETIYRSSNSFVVDGVSYELKKESTDAVNVTVNINTESAIKAIKTFVEDYNALIKGVNSKLVEKKYRSFTPLTDEQKSAMKDSEVKLWEERAKSGLLRSDPLLRDMLTEMRQGLTVKINGVSLADMGITTSTDWRENGKLEINEAKLKEALETKGTEISELFTTPTREGSNVKGIAYIFEDIINKNVGTIGEKGILLKKAGLEGDRTQNDNLIQDELDDYEKRIKELVTRMADKEEQLYSRFSKLETMMSKLNQQSGWLAQQLGGGK